MSIEETSDKVSFDLLSQRQPHVIAAITRSLEKGVSAAIIEACAFQAYGPASLTAAIIAGAAHHIEKAKTQGESS